MSGINNKHIFYNHFDLFRSVFSSICCVIIFKRVKRVNEDGSMFRLHTERRFCFPVAVSELFSSHPKMFT